MATTRGSSEGGDAVTDAKKREFWDERAAKASHPGTDDFILKRLELDLILRVIAPGSSATGRPSASARFRSSAPSRAPSAATRPSSMIVKVASVILSPVPFALLSIGRLARRPRPVPGVPLGDSTVTGAREGAAGAGRRAPGRYFQAQVGCSKWATRVDRPWTTTSRI